MMYSQDQFEPLMKHSCKTDTYHLTTNLVDNSLQLHLKTAPTHPEYHRYSTAIGMGDLEETLRQKFENAKNLQIFLCDPNNIVVDVRTGVIQLVISMLLPNGKGITTKLGEIRLREDIFDAQRCLAHVLDICEGEGEGKFNEKVYRNVMRQFANLIKVLFKKVENLQEEGHMHVSTDRQAFFSFNKTAGSSGKQIKYALQPSPLEKTFKGQKFSHERTRSVNEQSELMVQLDDRARTDKFKNENFLNNNREFEIYKILTDNKINLLTQRLAKEEQQFGKIKDGVEEMKKDIKSEIDGLKKELQIEKQRQQTQKEKQRKSSASRPKLRGNEFMMLHSAELEAQRHSLSPTISPIHSPSLRSKSPRSLQSIPQESPNANYNDSLKKLQSQFQDFSNAVITKIENLGVAHQLLEDKLKRVVQELDLKLEQRNMEESINEIKNKIIDMGSPFFQQFQLLNTQVRYKGQDSISTMLLGKIKIAEKNKFSIRIVKTLVSNIQIGIVDYEYRNARDCWSMPNFILYVGWNSTIYEGPNDMVHKEGQPIVEGDVITFRANIETGLMEWVVGGEVRAKAVWEKLKDKSINWVPVVRFYDHGDVIEWVTDKMVRR